MSDFTVHRHCSFAPLVLMSWYSGCAMALACVLLCSLCWDPDGPTGRSLPLGSDMWVSRQPAPGQCSTPLPLSTPLPPDSMGHTPERLSPANTTNTPGFFVIGGEWKQYYPKGYIQVICNMCTPQMKCVLTVLTLSSITHTGASFVKHIHFCLWGHFVSLQEAPPASKCCSFRAPFGGLRYSTCQRKDSLKSR